MLLAALSNHHTKEDILARANQTWTGMQIAWSTSLGWHFARLTRFDCDCAAPTGAPHANIAKPANVLCAESADQQTEYCGVMAGAECCRGAKSIEIEMQYDLLTYYQRYVSHKSKLKFSNIYCRTRANS